MEYNRWSDKNVSFFVVDLISSADCKVKDIVMFLAQSN